MKRILILSLLAMVIYPASAQLNLKKKFERKADEVVDDLLFGKKKKDKNSGSTSTSPTGEPNETYKPENEDAPLGGYVRKPVDYGRMNTGETVHFRDLIDFLPDEMGSFSISTKPDGASMRFGDQSYSYASKVYNSGEEILDVIIYDHLFTSAMYGTYANAYEYETTDEVMKSIEVKGFPGWYNSRFESGESEMILIVKNRFMLSISLDGSTEADLINYASMLELEKLPEGQAIEEVEPEEDSEGADDK